MYMCCAKYFNFAPRAGSAQKIYMLYIFSFIILFVVYLKNLKSFNNKNIFWWLRCILSSNCTNKEKDLETCNSHQDVFETNKLFSTQADFSSVWCSGRDGYEQLALLLPGAGSDGGCAVIRWGGSRPSDVGSCDARESSCDAAGAAELLRSSSLLFMKYWPDHAVSNWVVGCTLAVTN